MPYYEFVCNRCKRITLKFMRIKKAEGVELIDCRYGCGKTAKRIISKTSFHLKGGGWAKDNYDKTSKAS